MIEEYGVVEKILGDFAVIIADRTSMCGNCPSKGICNPFGEENKIKIVAYNKLKAKIGDKVKVAIDERSFLKASFIVYGIPILFLIIFSIGAKIIFKKDILSFFFGILGFIFSFLLIKIYDEKNKKKFNPKIIEIIDESSSDK